MNLNTFCSMRGKREVLNEQTQYHIARNCWHIFNWKGWACLAITTCHIKRIILFPHAYFYPIWERSAVSFVSRENWLPKVPPKGCIRWVQRCMTFRFYQNCRVNVTGDIFQELNLSNIPEPGVNILPTPPQQWYNIRQNVIRPQNMRPMLNRPPPMPPMIMPNPFMQVFNGSPNVPQSLNSPHLMPSFSQVRPQQRHQSGAGSGSKNWRTESNKSENRKNAPFVPLQAQKQHRNPNPRHSTGTTNSANSSHHGQQRNAPLGTNDATFKVWFIRCTYILLFNMLNEWRKCRLKMIITEPSLTQQSYHYRQNCKLQKGSIS